MPQWGKLHTDHSQMPHASPACSPALCPTATHPPPTRRCPTHLQIYGDDLRSMYTYNSSISAQADGRRALCTCERLGAGWAMGAAVTAWVPWLTPPAAPLSSPSALAAVEKYGGFYFETQAPKASVFAGAEAVEFWARPEEGASGLVLRLGNTVGVRRAWLAGCWLGVASHGGGLASWAVVETGSQR